MNPDVQSQGSLNGYYPLLNEEKNKNLTNQIPKNSNRPLNQPQQVQHNYQPFVQPIPQRQDEMNLRNQNQGGNQPVYNPYRQMYGQNNPNQNSYQNPNLQVLVNQQVPLHQNVRYQKPLPTVTIPIVTDKYDAIMNGQMIPCQKCGTTGNGNITHHSGSTACCWGTALFFLTGIFLYVPCLFKCCKDTHIECPKCGYTRAIVQAKCCC